MGTGKYVVYNLECTSYFLPRPRPRPPRPPPPPPPPLERPRQLPRPPRPSTMGLRPVTSSASAAQAAVEVCSLSDADLHRENRGFVTVLL